MVQTEGIPSITSDSPKPVGYAFTITQQTGQAQSISITGNFKEGVPEVEAFQELARFTECLDAVMKKINISVLKTMVADHEKQYEELEREVNSPRLGNKKAPQDLMNRFNAVRNQLDGERKALKDLSEELGSRWKWNLN